MSGATQAESGSVVSIWRHPVKSMMGEELNATEIAESGVLGDRAYAVMDRADRKVASAKNPRKWPNLFDFRANFVEPPHRGARLPPVRITLPDGDIVTSQQPDLDEILSRALNRDVTLAAIDPDHLASAKAEEYWPDMAGLEHRDTVTDFALPEGTFFDSAAVHVLTTATLNRLRELYPDGRFEVRRFRPNVVVAPTAEERSFVETAWIGRTLRIGDEVRLTITGPCPRCVMTTLRQGDLPKDPGILRASAQHNQTNVGVYAKVAHGGTIHRDDPVTLD